MSKYLYLDDYLRDTLGVVYTESTIKLVDLDGVELPPNKFFVNAPVISHSIQADGSIEVVLKVFNVMPDGWQKLYGASTAPNGFDWIHNKRIVFDPEYRHAMIRL